MQTFITTSFGWFKEHPFQVVFYVLALVVSIYGSDIKRYVHSRPGRVKEGYRQGAISAISSNIALLRRLHGNPYELLKYFISELVFVIVICNYVLIAVMAAQYYFTKRFYFSNFLILMFFSTVWGRARTVRMTLRQLDNYEMSLAQLEHELSRYKAAAAPTAENAAK